MTILPLIVVALSTLTLPVIFWILKHCLKWNIFGVADDNKSTTKSTILQETNVAPSGHEHKPQIEPSEANHEKEEESPEKNKSFPGEESEESSPSEETINLSHNAKDTSEQSYPDIIEEESFSSDHQLEFSPSKQSPATIEKTLAVKKCSVIVKKWKVPIKECGVLLRNCQIVPADIPVPQDLDSECKTSPATELESDSKKDNEDTDDKVIARRRKPVAVSTKDTVAPKTTIKRITKKPTIELPSPISINNNNSATKKKKKLFSLTPQQSEIFNPVEVKFSDVDPHNVVMKQLRDRRPKRK